MILEAGKRIVVLALLLLVALASASSMLDDPATEYVDAGMKRALTTFAVARSLNAAISLAQGTEVTAGVGAELTLSVGQVLDPVNDLVESFSDLMLMASVAFGIQKILIVIGQYHYVKWLVIAVLAVWGALYLLAKRTPRWLDQILVLMLLIRFAVPVVGVGSEAIYDRFLSTDYQQSATGLSTASDSVETTIKELRQDKSPTAQSGSASKWEVQSGSSSTAAPNPPPAAVPQSTQPPTFWERSKTAMRDMAGSAKDAVKDTVRKVDPRPYIDSLMQQAGLAVDHMINLIVVFILQTVLVPMFLLWAMYLALRSCIGKPNPS